MPPITSNLFQQVSYSKKREDPFINLPFRTLYHLQECESSQRKAAFTPTFAVDWYYWRTETLFYACQKKKKHSDQGTSTWFSCAAIYTGEVPISCGGETSKKPFQDDMKPSCDRDAALLPLEVVGLNAERSGSTSRKAIGGQQKHLQNLHHLVLNLERI